MPAPRPADPDFETRILPEATPFTVGAAFAVDAIEALLLAQHATDPVWWQQPVERVSVAAETPVAAASIWSMVEVAAAPTAATATEL
jgi:hypothetical protein